MLKFNDILPNHVKTLNKL